MINQDEFTRTLKKLMSDYGEDYMEISDLLVDRMMYYVKRGYSMSKAFKKVMDELAFEELSRESIENAVYEAALRGYGIKSAPVSVGGKVRHKLMDVAWSQDNMKLSTRIHGISKVMHNNIRSTVGRALRAYKSVNEIAMMLYDGYGNPDNVLQKAELPRYLTKIKKLLPKMYSGDKKAARESKIFNAVTHDIKKLKTKSLKWAYQNVVNATTSNKKRALQKARKMLKMGASKEEVIKMLMEERKKVMEKAMRIAIEEKTRYYAERIARTEAARAYYEGLLASTMNDPDVFGFKWVLSTAHVHKEHDCNCYTFSKIDIGWGKGIFPKEKVPYLPAHPNCMCHLKKVFAWEAKKTNGKDKMPKQPAYNNRIDEALKELYTQET